jgi:superfamily I DNA/RNA helicase
MPLKPIKLIGEQKRVLFLQVTEPIQIKGVAGSGKTTVALYRAKHLIDTQSNLFQEAKVVIFTYNKILVKYINAIKSSISGGYSEHNDEVKPTKPIGINGVNVINFDRWAYHFIESNGIPLYGKTVMGSSQKNIIASVKSRYSVHNITNKNIDFFLDEISWMKGQAFQNKEEYLDAKRTGRGTNDRVIKTDKEIIWNIYTDYNSQLDSRGLVDFDDYALLCLKIINSTSNFIPPFSHIIVDEAQDLSKAQILVITRLVSEQTKSLSIIADAAQRIYKSGFNWSEVGLNLRGGRTIEFKKNYRNTVSVINAALSLLSNEKDKTDFTTVESARPGGDKPKIAYFDSWEEQSDYLYKELNELKRSNTINSTVILHRNHTGIRSIKDFLESNNFEVQELFNPVNIDFENDTIKLCTLSSVKGLEFDNVFIIDLNDDTIPYPEGFNEPDDDFHISTERRLLYTSMTRTREKLFLLSSGNPSRYLNEIDEKYLDVIKKSSNNVSSWLDDLPF